MTKPNLDSFGGGYVFNERNQLQENSRILFDLPRRRDSIKGVVFDGEESQLAKPGRAEAGISVSRPGRTIYRLQYQGQ